MFLYFCSNTRELNQNTFLNFTLVWYDPCSQQSDVRTILFLRNYTLSLWRCTSCFSNACKLNVVIHNILIRAITNRSRGRHLAFLFHFQRLNFQLWTSPFSTARLQCSNEEKQRFKQISQPELNWYAALGIGCSVPPQHRGKLLRKAFLSSDPQSLTGNTKNPQTLYFSFFFLSLPLMLGQKGWHCFLGQAWISPHTWGSLFWWGYEREARYLAGMQKCRGKKRGCVDSIQNCRWEI